MNNHSLYSPQVNILPPSVFLFPICTGCLAGGYRDVKNHPFFKEVNFNKLVKKQIKAPWVPVIDNPLDISHFENFDADEEDFTKGKKPLSADEQLIFADF